tara:strand:- start:341 stop:520 length:180 start_codon:yes stop_codon:yes gene_type:complete
MVGFSAMDALPFGLIYDWTGTYDIALWILMVLPVAALIFALLAFPPILHTRANEDMSSF